MNRVWEYSAVGGSELLVLLAIADHAHDDGGGAWPSVPTLARKCKLSDRHVRRVIRALEDSGEIAVERGAGRNGVNVYTILSGTLRKNEPRCFMCGASANKVELDRHHTIPGDDTSVVRLCKPCHIKLHQLQEGSPPDSLSAPDTDDHEDLTPGAVAPDAGVSQTVNNHQENHQLESRAMFAALAEVCEINWRITTEDGASGRGALNQHEKQLREAGFKPSDVRAFRAWWDKENWRGQKGQAPTPAQVRQFWGAFEKHRGRARYSMEIKA